MSVSGWNLEWAARSAAVAMRYLADNCPASAGAVELPPHQAEAHAAAVARDRGRYLEALRETLDRLRSWRHGGEVCS